MTYSSCQVSADDEPGLVQRDVQVDFLQYGDIELDFPELNAEDYPDGRLCPNRRLRNNKTTHCTPSSRKLLQWVVLSLYRVAPDPPNIEGPCSLYV